MNRKTHSYLPPETDNESAKLIFGEKVRSLMNNLGMKQSDLARAAGLPRDAISTYVRGKVWPDPQNLRAVANALHVLPSDLIPGASEIEGFAKVSRHPRAATSSSSAPLTFTMIDSGRIEISLHQTLPVEVAMKIVHMVTEATATR